MNKTIIICCLLVACMTSMADEIPTPEEEIFLETSYNSDGEDPEGDDPTVVDYDDPDQTTPVNRPRVPMRAPRAFLSNHSLFLSYCNGFSLEVMNPATSQVVYTDFIPAGFTECQLPATLHGEFVVRLTYGRWSFTGWITL